MPSFKNLVRASISLTSLSSLTPESVAITSLATGEQLVGYFSGWTASFKFANHGFQKAADVSTTAPLTVLTSTEKTVTCAWVKDQIKVYKEYDDVFEEHFLQSLYLQGASCYEPSLLACLKAAYGTEVIFAENGSDETYAVKAAGAVPNGPYVAYFTSKEALLGPVYRIYQDDHMAFMSGILPNGTEGAFRYANVNTMSDSTVGIPVPSRLYSMNATTESKPLEGVRITVKDIIDVEGVKTSNGNRAWFKLYDIKNASAPALQKVLELGAVPIGKTKTAQFANADRPTADWVDYHDAFNPRGDGYQDPGVSSAGAGASTAAYDWVDVSLCTDTGGSIRIPASKNGVFGLRPSFGALPNDGVMMEGEYFDSVGFHTRSPYMLRDFGKAWLADSKQLTTKYTRFPRKLIVPNNLWPVTNNASQTVFTEWIDKLAGFLNATVDTRGIGDFWNATAHEEKPGTEFFSYMKMVAFNLIWRKQIETVITPFRKAYAAAFGGRKPFINPYPAARYIAAENITQADVDDSYKRFTFFRDWFGKSVVKPDTESCSESLFLLPMFAGDVSYRNTVYSAPNVGSWSSFLMYYYSVQSQSPEAVFPIGQVSYLSNITGVEEKLPVVIDVLAHRNCDLMLLDLATALAEVELLKEVKTGSTLW